MENQNISQREKILKELSLGIRPSLDVTSDKLKEIGATLSGDALERFRFVKDPVSYLNNHSVPISSGKLVVQEPAMTSEVCNAAACIAVAALAIWTIAAASTLVAVSAVAWNTAWVLGGGGGGCFLAGTRVSTRRKRDKPIQNIAIGEEVLSYNEIERRLEYNPITRVFRTEQPMYFIINDTIKVTARHRFWVNEKEWRQVKDLKVGDFLLNNDLEPVAVEAIDVVEKKATVYNLTVNKAHTYFVHDVLVHNDKPRCDDCNSDRADHFGSLTTVL